jgi:hypothetical protein
MTIQKKQEDHKLLQSRAPMCRLDVYTKARIKKYRNKTVSTSLLKHNTERAKYNINKIFTNGEVAEHAFRNCNFKLKKKKIMQNSLQVKKTVNVQMNNMTLLRIKKDIGEN